MKTFIVKDRNLPSFIHMMNKNNPDIFARSTYYPIDRRYGYKKVTFYGIEDLEKLGFDPELLPIEGKLYKVIGGERESSELSNGRWFYEKGEIIKCLVIHPDGSGDFTSVLRGLSQSMDWMSLQKLIEPYSYYQI